MIPQKVVDEMKGFNVAEFCCSGCKRTRFNVFLAKNPLRIVVACAHCERTFPVLEFPVKAE